MKRMKHFLCIILCLVLFASLASCSKAFELWKPKEEIAKIEIINSTAYIGPKPEEMELLCTIPAPAYDELLEKLFSMPYHKIAPPIECSEGLCVKITFQDGGFQLISSKSVATVKPKGNYVYYLAHFDDPNDFLRIVEKYLAEYGQA